MSWLNRLIERWNKRLEERNARKFARNTELREQLRSGQTIGIEPGPEFEPPTMALDALPQERRRDTR